MWHDRRVIVTGGTAGFGLVLARHLAAAGAQVLVVGRSGEGVRLALAALEMAGRNVRGVAADLEKPGEGRRVVGECLRIFGGVDDLFCCVGRSGRGRILETPEAELRAYLDANLFAAAEITQAAADDVAAAKGHVVYVGSLAGKLVVPFMGAYSVAKSALAAYADAVRLELTPRGAHVLLVSPGPIRRAGDDPAAARSADRYAADVTRSGLPAEAAAPGGTAALRRLDPDALARRVLDACRRRRSELTVPGSARFLAGLIEWFPEAGRRLLARVAGRGR
jgi:NAD(P)-dependent dehydrogenase (short-subunit alcohol dehydrogenase family)